MPLHTYYIMSSLKPSYQAANIALLHFTNEGTDTQKLCLRSQWVAGFRFPWRPSECRIPMLKTSVFPPYPSLSPSTVLWNPYLTTVSNISHCPQSFSLLYIQPQDPSQQHLTHLNLFHFKTFSCTSSYSYPTHPFHSLSVKCSHFSKEASPQPKSPSHHSTNSLSH